MTFNFWALYQTYSGNEPNIFLKLAVEKLTNGIYGTCVPSNTGMLAVLDQQLQLTYDPQHLSTHKIVEDQVASHMWLC
jgi:hypothetical protein